MEKTKELMSCFREALKFNTPDDDMYDVQEYEDWEMEKAKIVFPVETEDEFIARFKTKEHLFDNVVALTYLAHNFPFNNCAERMFGIINTWKDNKTKSSWNKRTSPLLDVFLSGYKNITKLDSWSDYGATLTSLGIVYISYDEKKCSLKFILRDSFLASPKFQKFCNHKYWNVNLEIEFKDVCLLDVKRNIFDNSYELQEVENISWKTIRDSVIKRKNFLHDYFSTIFDFQENNGKMTLTFNGYSRKKKFRKLQNPPINELSFSYDSVGLKLYYSPSNKEKNYRHFCCANSWKYKHTKFKRRKLYKKLKS